jgi:hypothetical protein
MIKITEEEYVEHTDGDDGICLACGDWVFGGVEPDAENYHCEYCNENQVYGTDGTEQALILGKLDII